MLTLSTRQLEVFKQKASEAFLDRAVVYLRKYDPARATAGDAALRSVAESGLAKARGYGFTLENNVFLILETMVTLGYGFDSDPQYYWLKSILKPDGKASENERASRLHWHLISYLDRVYGETGESGRGALERAAELDLEKLAAKSVEFSGRMEAFLGWIHPKKAEFIGNQAIAELCQSASLAADSHGLKPPAGLFVMVALMFGFGHQVLEDPLFPWIGRSFEDTANAGDPDRLGRLATKVKVYVRAMLSDSSYR